MKESEQNFTVGKVSEQLFKFTVPLFFANLLQAGYNIADMVVVGRYVGSSGLAAVSNASMLCFIITSIGIGITVALHLWQRQMLLSIAGGTIAYMLLVQLVF